MKESTKVIVSFATGLISVAWTLYMTYLLYNLVHATDLMWFMFWTYIPLVFIFHGISAIIKRD